MIYIKNVKIIALVYNIRNVFYFHTFLEHVLRNQAVLQFQVNVYGILL